MEAKECMGAEEEWDLGMEGREDILLDVHEGYQDQI